MEIFGRRLFGGPTKAEVEALAKGLGDAMLAKIPPGTEPSAGPADLDRKAERKLAKALNQVLLSAHDFKARHELGVYGKARVANSFKWELRERGYNDAFIEEATKALVLVLS